MDILSDARNQEAKRQIFGALKQALADNPYECQPIVRNYRRDSSDAPGSETVINVFVDALEDYKAVVKVVEKEEQIAPAVKEFLGDAKTVVIPSGLPAAWQKELSNYQVTIDQPGQQLSNLELDQIDAVVTSSRCAVSHTGTIMLDGTDDQGRRAITLVPDTHVVVVKAKAIYPTVPQAVEVLSKNPLRPVTWIAGPSATSDIELIRVDGVHGPRNLRVIIVKE